ncbi:MAG: tRNA (N6-threonylcarbamoyladenosine(37)-N6)-methyltransferase TrmO [Proteobacteria bacterium]|nr:tRNA (N6-threonylcarbamoyladenosine(37)-N6)-methyltransferase TrmO [Pseudomonadota bacterium]MBU1387873.1 tRNA (N6-threonylcarbamoyladenosine(37)-N6)-methyltransferase TrmO [Pseudomonadota bacterium]MBU1541356.1 tRNA (N6-threonylcarbamoyladenosine(37)-N6)-methyltransferase TrmO [Pseudomonadota bacterium]MBU2482435.1 tRNA (N6-threonylcarbamoyladenosine(37)-N6)-methyltransferase TrmO [Pseudomonadota bacterium]
MIEIFPIGTIHTPFESLEGMPIQPSEASDVEGTVVLEPEYEQGLTDIEGFSHIMLLFWLHKSKGYDLMVKPFLDDQKRGLFSTRAPRRPNPVGLSIVRLLDRKGPVLTVKGIDILNNTPLIDIKPYVPKFDIKEVTRSGWLEKNQLKAADTRSDDRFVQP